MKTFQFQTFKNENTDIRFYFKLRLKMLPSISDQKKSLI